ncbi:MAG: S41 family peptidase [Chitinophagales bacterium]|nr:S41 family peptidase [Chitinophagales bacterium]MDW8420148.1 S41 family peptidase [Chitinophagales bacterium]
MDNGEKEWISNLRGRKENKQVYMPLVFSLVLAFGVLLGYMVNSVTTGKTSIIASSGYDKIQEVLRHIQWKYVDTVNTARLTDMTIDQMLSNLDPHSVYIPAREMAETNEQLEGNFEGIGIEFFIVQDTITVVNAIPGGPAESLGIRAGDRIVKINDTIVAGIKIKETDVKKKLRGPSRTQVKVSILRAAESKPIDYVITRGKIPLISVDAGYMIDSRTGYIRVSNFSATTANEFREKLNILRDAGMQHLILDLRGNPGGYLQAATEMVDELLDDGKLIVYTTGKATPRTEYKSHRAGLFEDGKVCVLIDQWSASASEIMAGAIQDWDRGIVVGRNSFGKGLVQEQFRLRDGSGLRLTVSRYYTPSGRCIQRDYKNGKDNYYEQINERYFSDEFPLSDTLPASDTVTYKTLLKGRKVYGGGGIHPDVFVPVDTTAPAVYLRKIRSYIPEFVYKETSLHPDMLKGYTSVADFASRFTVSDGTLNEFYRYATGRGLNKDDKKFTALSDKIKLYIKAHIAKQLWRMDGYYYIANTDDEVIRAALKQF